MYPKVLLHADFSLIRSFSIAVVYITTIVTELLGLSWPTSEFDLNSDRLIGGNSAIGGHTVVVVIA